jgi:hypothetical protein
MTKAAMNKKTPFTSKFGREFKEENSKVMHLGHDAETCTLRKVDQKYLENFEMCCWKV